MTTEFMFTQGAFGVVLIALSLFGWKELWPWLRDRDQVERDHRHALEQRQAAQQQIELDRRHELEQRQVETDGLMASALTALAGAVAGCPLRPDA